MPEDWQTRADLNYRRIKRFYESKGGTKWHEVTADPRLFNRVWRHMLGIDRTDEPPPVGYR